MSEENMELVRVAYADCGSTRDRVSDGDGYLEGAATPPVLGTVAVPGASPPGAAPYSGACSTSSSSGNDGEATALAPLGAARQRGRGSVASIRDRSNAGFAYWLVPRGVDDALAR